MQFNKYFKTIKSVNSSFTILQFVKDNLKDREKYFISNTCAVIKDKKLVGSVSYGDIKRKFSDLEGSVKLFKIMNKNPVKLVLTDNYNKFIKQLIIKIDSSDIEFIYIVDDKNSLLGVLDRKIILNFNDINFCETTILGLGFVGLTLAMHLLKYNIKVNGIDKDKKLISDLRKNKTKINENGLTQILKLANKNKKFPLFNDLLSSNLSKIYIVTVGTPLTNKKVDNSFVLGCLKEISKKMNKNSLIILRSTIQVGSSRSLFIPTIEKLTKKKCGVDWHFVYAPERTIEGNALKELNLLPQIIAGYSKECLRKARNYFSNFSSEIIDMESLEMAEFSKLICNTYRDLSFAFANEVALLSEGYNINTNKLINLSNKGYPRGGIPMSSPGVGGACLTKDPYIYSLSNYKNKSHKSILGSISREINLKSSRVPFRIINKYIRGNKIKKIEIIILGLSFKGDHPNKDVRYSNSKKLADYCVQSQYDTYVYDPFFSKDEILKMGYRYFNLHKPVKKSIKFIFVMNNCEIFKNINLREWFQSKEIKIFFDGWYLFPELNIDHTNYHYTSMGKLK